MATTDSDVKVSISMISAEAKKTTKSFDGVKPTVAPQTLRDFSNSYIKITNAVTATAKKTTSETIQLSTTT